MISLFGHQLGDKVSELVFESRRALAVELVIAEVDEQIGKVIALFRDSQAQTLRDGFRHLVRVNADRVLAGQPQIMGEAPRQFLHKGIDGTHAETAIVMHDLCHQALCITFQVGIGNAQFLYQLGFHRLGIDLLALNDFFKRRYDFGFHVVGRRVGEGNGEDVPKITHSAFVGQAQFQVLLDERKGLPRACRGLKDFEISGIIHGKVLFS